MTKKIFIISCNWDGWSCIDAALNSRQSLPSYVDIIKVPCISSVNSGFILRSFELKIDGIMLIGCLNQQCLYGQYSCHIEKEIENAKEILKILGINKERVLMTRLSPFDGDGLLKELNTFSLSLKDTFEYRPS